MSRYLSLPVPTVWLKCMANDRTNLDKSHNRNKH